MTDHDKLFKQLLRYFLPDLVTLVTPELEPELRLDRIRFLDKESFSRLPGGKRVQMDLVARVETRSGRPKMVLIHVEIQAEHDTVMDRRMWRYYMHLRLNHRLPVVPIVVNLRGGPGGISRREVVDRIGELDVALFRYHVFGLAKSQAEDYLARPEPLAWALAALMRSVTLDDVERKAACLRAIARGRLDEVRSFVLANIVETYVQLSSEDDARFRVILEKDLEVRAMELTWAGKAGEYEARGWRRGEAAGLERGRLEGARHLVIKIFEQRFGPVPDTIRERIEMLRELPRLEELSTRLVTAESLDDLDFDSSFPAQAG